MVATTGTAPFNTDAIISVISGNGFLIPSGFTRPQIVQLFTQCLKEINLSHADGFQTLMDLAFVRGKGTAQRSITEIEVNSGVRTNMWVFDSKKTFFLRLAPIIGPPEPSPSASSSSWPNTLGPEHVVSRELLINREKTLFVWTVTWRRTLKSSDTAEPGVRMEVSYYGADSQLAMVSAEDLFRYAPQFTNEHFIRALVALYQNTDKTVKALAERHEKAICQREGLRGALKRVGFPLR